MSVLAGPINGFGYRTDSDANTPATATSLPIQNGNQVSASGLIVTTSDTDFYSFDSGPGPVSFTVSVPADVSNLAPKLELLDASGQRVIAAAGPSATDFSASVSATLPSGGSYRLLVASNGGYGNVGHYFLSGTVSSPSNPGSAPQAGTGTGPDSGISPLSPPSSVSATAVSTSGINLLWTDPPSGATGYAVERTSDGLAWNTIAYGLAPGTFSFSDTSVSPGASYGYRVSTNGPTGTLSRSSAVWATTPPPPPGQVSASAVAPNRIDVVWSDAFGATGFWIERSINGKTWTTVGNLGPGSTHFVDTAVVPNASYYYQVQAYNSSGASLKSPVSHVRTPRIRVAPGRGRRPPPRIAAHRAALHTSTARQAPGRSRPHAAAASLQGTLPMATTPIAKARELWATDQVLRAWQDDR
jgi:hypothetical protein